MFWMTALFANIVLLFGINNKNRCNLLVWLMYNKMLMLLLLFSLFFPGIPFFAKERYTGTTDSRLNAKSNRFMVIITVVILYIGSIAVKLFYDQLDSRLGPYHSSDTSTVSHGRSFPATWPINWSAYSNPTLRPIPNLLENNRSHTRISDRRQSRRQRMQARRNRRNDNTSATDIQSQGDILQDVMDMNTLLCKLKNILMESGVMENHIFEGQEKCDLSEKSLRDENTELKQQILSLQKNLEEKDKKIKLIEAKLRSQMNSIHHASTQT